MIFRNVGFVSSKYQNVGELIFLFEKFKNVQHLTQVIIFATFFFFFWKIFPIKKFLVFIQLFVLWLFNVQLVELIEKRIWKKNDQKNELISINIYINMAGN